MGGNRSTRRKPQGERANSTQTVTRGQELNLGPWRCEAAVLTQNASAQKQPGSVDRKGICQRWTPKRQISAFQMGLEPTIRGLIRQVFYPLRQRGCSHAIAAACKSWKFSSSQIVTKPGIETTSLACWGSRFNHCAALPTNILWDFINWRFCLFGCSADSGIFSHGV